MSTIILNSLHCEKLQDSASEDEIEVRVDGVQVFGPVGVHKDGTVNLGGVTRTFTDNVSVQVVELDGNKTPDNLGLRIVSAKDSGGTLIFDAASKAFYTLSYRVS